MTADEAEAVLTNGRLLRAVLDRAEATHERSQQLAPGHSSVGSCRRRAAYGLQGHPADDGWVPTAGVQAAIGRAVHSFVLPQLRRVLHPARIELETTWRPEGLPPIVGHVDFYRRRSALVLDLKTVSRHQFNRAADEGGKHKDWLQVHANAAGLRGEGKPVEQVALLYVCTETSQDRADDEGLLLVRQVDYDLLREVTRWWTDVAGPDHGDALPPRDEPGPGLSWMCDGCPWLRACWGPDAKPGRTGPQAAVDDEARAAALDLLTQSQVTRSAGNALVKAADKDRDFAEAVLGGTPDGTYAGEAGTFRLSWGRGQVRADTGAMRGFLTDMGVGIPTYRTASHAKAERVDRDDV
jgi:hypothetical protein